MGIFMIGQYHDLVICEVTGVLQDTLLYSIIVLISMQLTVYCYFKELNKVKYIFQTFSYSLFIVIGKHFKLNFIIIRQDMLLFIPMVFNLRKKLVLQKEKQQYYLKKNNKKYDSVYLVVVCLDVIIHFKYKHYLF